MPTFWRNFPAPSGICGLVQCAWTYTIRQKATFATAGHKKIYKRWASISEEEIGFWKKYLRKLLQKRRVHTSTRTLWLENETQRIFLRIYLFFKTLFRLDIENPWVLSLSASYFKHKKSMNRIINECTLT